MTFAALVIAFWHLFCIVWLEASSMRSFIRYVHSLTYYIRKHASWVGVIHWNEKTFQDSKVETQNG